VFHEALLEQRVVVDALRAADQLAVAVGAITSTHIACFGFGRVGLHVEGLDVAG